MTLQEYTNRLNELIEQAQAGEYMPISFTLQRQLIWAEYKAAQEGGAK